MKSQLKTCVAALSLLTATVFAADLRIDGFPDYDTQIDKIKNKYIEQTGNTVTMLKNNHGDHHNKLKTNLATGTGAGDVVLLDIDFIGSFVNSGGFVDLTPYYKDIAGNYADYAVEAGKGTDGKQYAVPVDLGPGVVYFRRDYMEDMGFDINAVMADWDAYIDYGRALKKKNVWLIGNAAAVANAYLRFNLNEGEGWYFDADGKPLVTSERFIRAFELAKTIRDEGLDGNFSEWTEDWYAGCRDGKFATQMSGAWLLGHLKNWIAPKTAGKWGVSGLPGGIYGRWGGSYLAIPKQAKDPDASWSLIQYMITENTQIEGFRNIAAFPAHTGTYDDPVFAEPVEFLNGQKARMLFADIAEHVLPVKPMKGDLIAEELIQQALDKVLNNGADIEKTLKDVERQLKRRVR